MKTTLLLKSLVIASALSAASSHASIAHLWLNGTPGDGITDGRTVNETFSSADPELYWNFITVNNIGTEDAPLTDYVSFTLMRSDRSGGYSSLTSVDFSTDALGVPMTAGTFYDDARRATLPVPGHAGLDIEHGGVGCLEVSGSYAVERLSFKAGVLDEFSASFVQSCDGGAAMRGSFYYNASLTALPPSQVPEPASLALLGLGVAGLGMTRQRKQTR